MMKIVNMSCLSLILIFFISNSLVGAQGLEIHAYVNRSSVGLNQQFELTVEISGPEANGAPQPPIPQIDEFASYLGSSSATNMQILNGRMSVTKTYSYHFIATKEGKFRIPPISITFKGNTYSTAVINFEVVKGQATTPPSPSQNRDSPQSSEDLSQLLFLKASVNKRRVFQNEPVIVRYKIYTALNVTNYGVTQLPNTVGFWSEDFELPQRPKLYSETVNGRQFRVAEIKKVALFPQGPGEKTLDPLVIECDVQMPRQRRRRRDIFDSIFDDPFFDSSLFGRTVRRTLTSNSMAIDVLPLPQEGKPQNFSGAVGDFTISASVDKNSVKTNEAISLKLNIAGTGNIKILPQPEIKFPSDFEVYDPKIQENIKRKSGKISGSKSFEYVLIPRFAGTQKIKPIDFSFFDLNTKNYKTVSTLPIDITVTQGDEQFVTLGAGASKEDVKFIGQDIRYIQTASPEFNRIGSVFYKSPFFYTILILPLFVLSGSFVYRRHLDKMSSNVAYARSRKANQMALKRLKNANKEMNSGDAKQFYGEVSNALMGFIGDKLNVPPAGLITDEVESLLRERGIEKESVSNYIECLQSCDFQRFALSGSDNGQMKDFFEKVKKAIVNLDKVI